MIGRHVGSYEITARLGAGGMGEVYRARDPRLDRDVALKILPDAFAGDPDRLMRFTREAKTLAALNHPNIAAIYGVEEDAASGQRALVMELVEGEDLSDRIARGPVPVDEALSIAKQIADALGAAHDAGIVHRDLKPANVKVRADGTVKVLDFGLAKAMSPADSGSSASVAQSPTMTSPALTAMGLIIGTAAYMSPEQAKGRPVDRRADIWAFGVILHEMLTGRRLFEAEDVTETLAAVLTRDVSAASLPAHLPSGLRALVTDCLARDPKKRLRDISDIRLLLDKVDRAPADAQAGAAPPPRGAARWLWPAIASVAALAALGASALYLNKPAADTSEVVAFEISAPNLAGVDTISPDGRHVVFATDATTTSPSRLWLRSLDAFEATPVPGTEDVRARAGPAYLRPVWAPDNRTIVVSGAESLYRVDTATGQRANLVPRENRTLVPGAWSRDGVILYGARGASGSGTGVWRVAASGGAPVQLTRLRAGEVTHVPAAFLPDGRRFLYLNVNSGFSGASGNDVRIGSIDAAPEAQSTDVVVRTTGLPVYADGHLLFVIDRSLMAQPFDAERGVVTGTAIQLVSGAGVLISASENGRLVYRSMGGEAGDTSEIVRFHRSGRVIAKIGQPGVFGDVNALRGGAHIAVSRGDGGPHHLFVADLARGTFTRLSPGTNTDYAAAPSPEGTIAYTFSPEGLSRDIYVRAANGVGDARRLVASDNVKHANGWSPDGRFLMYDDHTAGQAQDLFVVRREGGTPIPFLTTAADETYGQFSPDGKWIAYASTESSRFEVYVRDFAPDRSPAYGTEKIQISVNGGSKPRWSTDGSEILFLQGNTMTAVKVKPGKPFQAGSPTALFDTRPVSYVPFDVLPDGSFVVNNAVDARPATAPPLRVMLNWPAALRKSR